jgi:hypothetical protein
MKTTLYKMVNTAILSGLLMAGCYLNEPLPDTPTADYSIIDGDTVKTVVFKDYKKLKDKDPNGKNYITVGDTIVTYKEPKLHTPPGKDPDLSKLKNNDDPDLKGKPLRMVAIGGSLTAGVRDGGYFNEGILTSYPNLIARQMKLKKFEQPLFDAQDYNGFGRKTRTGFNPTGGPVKKFNEVKNNSGVEGFVETEGAYGNGKADKVILKGYKNQQGLDNFGIPRLTMGALIPTLKVKEYQFSKANKTNRSFLERVVIDNNDTYTKQVYSKKFDFFTYEIGWDEIIDLLVENVGYGANSAILPDFEASKKLSKAESIDSDFDSNAQTKFLRKMKDNKVKFGVFLNLPNIQKLPYFTFIKQDKIKDAISTLSKETVYFKKYGGMNVNYVNLFPVSSVDSLLGIKVHPNLKKGLTSSQPLNDSDLILESNIIEAGRFIKDLNKQTAIFAQFFNCPVVDINTLYEKILAGTYITNDGLKVDGAYPNGNFFSSDGIYPTALGQAVIANEIIKSLNDYYKMEIPFIATREYLSIK